MRCPRCKSDSEVVDSRPTSDGFIRRRRLCVNGHRFKTWESTFAPSRQRWARKNGAAAVAKWRAANPEKVKRLRDREKISREAREESTKTGEPVKAIRKRWGLE